MKPTCVQIDGPFEESNGEWEYPTWSVAMLNDHGDECGKVYTCRSHAAAATLGGKIARDRRIELVDDSTPL